VPLELCVSPSGLPAARGTLKCLLVEPFRTVEVTAPLGSSGKVQERCVVTGATLPNLSHHDPLIAIDNVASFEPVRQCLRGPARDIRGTSEILPYERTSDGQDRVRHVVALRVEQPSNERVLSKRLNSVKDFGIRIAYTNAHGLNRNRLLQNRQHMKYVPLKLCELLENATKAEFE
jgi:hypothetical protein